MGRSETLRHTYPSPTIVTRCFCVESFSENAWKELWASFKNRETDLSLFNNEIVSNGIEIENDVSHVIKTDFELRRNVITDQSYGKVNNLWSNIIN